MAKDTEQKALELQLAQQLKAALKDQAELLRQINSLTENQVNALRTRTDLGQEIVGLLDQRSKLLRESITHDEEAVAAAQRYLEKVQKLGKSIAENNLRREARRDLHQKNITYYQKAIKLGATNSAELSKALTKEQGKLKTLDKQEAALGRVHARIKDTLGPIHKMADGLREGWEAVKAGPATVAGLFASLAVGPIMGLLNKAFSMLKRSVIDVFFAIDNVTHAFQRATGMGEKYNDGMIQTFDVARKYGITMENLGAQYESLIANVSDFSLETEAAGRRLAETGAYLERVGIQADDFAKGVQNSMKMFGQSMMGAEETARELLETSKALGIPPKQLAADYAKMGGSLAKLGRDGPQAFKELARVSKITGLEMEKVLQITNKFDTFEGAATQAGQLNAALGGNFVNAMDMMMTTDPVQRFEQLRDAISNTGLEFDDMSYYQKQFYTNAMGLSDVGDLALMMSGNMDMMSGATQKSAADYEELARQAEATMSLQEKFNAFLADLAPILEDLMDKAHEWMDDLRDNDELIERVRKTVVTLAKGLEWLAENWEYVLELMWKIPTAIITVTGLFKAMNLMIAWQNRLNIAKIAKSPALVGAMIAESEAAAIQGTTMGGASIGVGAFGVAMAIAGIAIGVVVASLGYLISSFADLFEVMSVENTKAFGSFVSNISTIDTGFAARNLQKLIDPLNKISKAINSLDLDNLVNMNTLLTELDEGLTVDTPGSKTLGNVLHKTSTALMGTPVQNIRALTDTMRAAEMAAKAADILVRSGGSVGSGAPPAAGGGNTLPPNTSLGTVKLTFNNPLFREKVVAIATDTYGQIKVQEQVEKTSP